MGTVYIRSSFYVEGEGQLANQENFENSSLIVSADNIKYALVFERKGDAVIIRLVCSNSNTPTEEVYNELIKISEPPKGGESVIGSYPPKGVQYLREMFDMQYKIGMRKLITVHF